MNSRSQMSDTRGGKIAYQNSCLKEDILLWPLTFFRFLDHSYYFLSERKIGMKKKLALTSKYYHVQ